MFLGLEIEGNFRFRAVGQCYVPEVFKKQVYHVPNDFFLRTISNMVVNYSAVEALKDVVFYTLTKTIPCDDFAEHLSFIVRGAGGIDNSNNSLFSL